MEPVDLNRFLASVRKTRFIDYLDPIGMSAEDAFEQRLKWANRNASEAAYSDEAEFLLKHATALREHVEREAANPEEWIDAVEAGMDAPPPVWGGENRITHMSDSDTDDAPTVHVGHLSGIDFMDNFVQDDLPTVHVDDMGMDGEDAPTVLRPAPRLTEDGEYEFGAIDAPVPPLDDEDDGGSEEEDTDFPTVLGVSPGLIPEDEETEDPTVFVGRDSIDEVLNAVNAEEDGEDPTVFLGSERINEVLGERTADDPTVAGKFAEIDEEDSENERTSITRLDDLAAADGTSRPASDLGARLAEVRARRAETSPEDDNTVFNAASPEHDSLFHSPTGAVERESRPARGGMTIIPEDDFESEALEEFDLMVPPIPGYEADIETAEAPKPGGRGGAGSATFPPMDALLKDKPASTPAPVPSIDTPVNTPEAKVVPTPKATPPAPKTPPKTQEESSGGGMSMALVGVALLALVGAVVCGIAVWQGGMLTGNTGEDVVVVAPEPAEPEPARRDTAAPPVPTPVATVADADSDADSDADTDGTDGLATIDADSEADTDADSQATTVDVAPEPVAPAPVPVAPAPVPVAPAPVPVAPAPVPVAPAPVPVAPTPAPVRPAPVASPSPRPAPVVTTRTPPASQLRSGTPAAQSTEAPVANVVGTWRGDVGNSTSVLLRMRSQTDSNVTAKVEIYDGTAWTEANLNGTYDASTGALAMSGSGVTVNGTVNGSTAVGSIRFSGKNGGWKLRKL